ncbi:hypothetical protein BB560_004022 [Smittium megazygosporum]|uniref:Phosphatidylethanolamine-binding protein n=1 Tax=Smittium megazygosporum TaxID=133381 RepID=A0A2T9ZAD7_9FUNG|nr:hypothetical protein BB560_004022 [Smittium megazygosporum]
MKNLFFCAAVLFGLVSADYHPRILKGDLEKIRRGELIPSVFPENFAPTTELRVSYVNRQMRFGTEYFPYRNETDNIPVIKYKTERNAFYTIALVDPDAPSRADPYRAQVRHWLNVNIPGDRIDKGNSTGTPYLRPAPFAGCGRKRFVYVLAKQECYMPNLTVPQARPNFNVTEFCAQNRMKIIGGNYFEVESEPGPTCTIPGSNPTTSTSRPITTTTVYPITTISRRIYY